MKKTDEAAREFLSGEADINLMATRFSLNQSRINDRKSMLNGSIKDANKNFDGSKMKNGSPLIQVIDEIETDEPTETIANIQNEKESVIDSNQSSNLDSENLPPPLIDIYGSASKEHVKLNKLVSDGRRGLSMMEIMMAEATKSKKEMKKKQMEKERKENSKASFAPGFKKGFLSNTSRSKKGASKKNAKGLSKNSAKEENSMKIYEPYKEESIVGTDRVIPPPLNSNSYKQTKQTYADTFIPTVKPTQNINPLRLEEVQEAMRKDGDSFLQKNVEKWATPELMEKTISKNKTLMSGFTNPSFKAAIEEFQSNPQSTILKEKMAKDITFRIFIQEFMQVMGNHFIELGNKRKESTNESELSSTIAMTETENLVARTKNNQKKEDLGPFVERTLEKLERATHEKSKNSKTKSVNSKQQENHTKINPTKQVDIEQEKQVQRIIEDKELTQILMDPDMQRIMHECSVPGKMREYMHHPAYGRKLRKLIESGLLRIA